MCTVSYVGDYWKKTLPDRHPWTDPWVHPPGQRMPPWQDVYTQGMSPTREEFEALKKEVEELKKLLEAAQKFDEATGQPHCEHEDKVDLIKRIAKLVGVDMKDVLK